MKIAIGCDHGAFELKNAIADDATIAVESIARIFIE